MMNSIKMRSNFLSAQSVQTTLNYKRFQSLFLLAFIVLAFSSCEKEMVIDDPKVDQENIEILEFLAAQEYNIDSVEFQGDYVIYERDGVWSKNELLKTMRGEYAEPASNDPDYEDMQNASFRQQGVREVNRLDAVTSGNVANITYFIRPSIVNDCGVAWRNAIGTGAADWNDLSNCRVDMTRVFIEANADIVFGSDIDTGMPAVNQNLPGSVIGRATFPSAGVPGRFISINASNDGFIWKKLLVIHELGHCLGFRHTGTNDGEHIHGTPNTETNSVMNPSIGLFSTANFKTGDKRMARIYYPSVYTRPVNFEAASGDRGSVKISYRNANASVAPYYWVRVAKYTPAGRILAVQYFQSTTSLISGNHSLEWNGHAPGTYLFAVRGCNFRRDIWSSRTPQISVTID